MVDEAEFEIKSDSISAIPCLSERLEKNQKLFENCIFFLEDESNSGSSELYILLKMCGAEILPSESVCFSKRKLLSKRVYLVGNVNESIKQQLIGLEISFSEVDASWIYDCICLDSIVEI